jgi:peptidoglycan/xylan/chitin deacetylase (PgdA/CDA1 family)
LSVAIRIRRGQASTSDVLVLCYHAVSDDWPATLAVTTERLEQQLALLARRGYRGMTFTDAVTRPAPGKVLAVTFDDGYRSVFERAFPVLERLGLPGTVFVPTGLIGAEGPMAWPGIDHWLDSAYEDELTPMSWDELGQLADVGWEVGSHTCTHRRLTSLDQPALESELRDSRRECEKRMGSRCRSLSYPYGIVDPRVAEETRKAGYEAAATLPHGGFDRPRPLCWPRIGVYDLDREWRFRVKASPFARTLRSLRTRNGIDRMLRSV